MRLGMRLPESKMKLAEIMVGLDSLRYDLEQWKLNKRNTNYYDEVLAEAVTALAERLGGK